jgi:alginate O-acetyltransferase complex protein AlgI
MNFQSLNFVIFIIITFLSYWIVKKQYQWIVILVANFFYYACYGIKYCFLLSFIIGISYFAGIMIEREKDEFNKKIILTVSIITNILPLFIFKYFDFTQYSISSFTNFLKISYRPDILELSVPVGISFYTFISISYVIDIYRKNIRAEYHIGIYAAFVSFFPHILAGPISRTKDVLPQIKNGKEFDYNTSVYGLKLIAWGRLRSIL